MINYEPFWKTLKKKKITTYQLNYHWGFSTNTFRRMRHGEAVSTTTLNQLCLILNCKIQDIIRFEATEEETLMIEQQRAEIKNKRAKK